jgi:hypothetical protein
MKKGIIFCLICTLSLQLAHAQNIVEKITQYKIDSLKHIDVDTIIYYHSYCGECIIPNPKHTCTADYGYTLTANVLIYRQNGNFYSLDFDCYNLPVKKQLDNCKSIPYALSIIPTLNARDKTLKAMSKKRKFLGPVQADGDFEKVSIYYVNKQQSLSMASLEKDEFYKTYRKYYWINSQIKLLKLISIDLATKK